MRTFTLRLILLSGLSFSPWAFSNALCPAVNCDCASLPKAPWQQECRQAEQRLIEACQANQGQPKGFCSLHGPAATPLPLAASLSPQTPTNDANAIGQLEQQLATALWSLTEDLSSLQTLLDKNTTASVSIALKWFDNHAQEAFELQQRILASRLFAKDAKRAEANADTYAKALKPVLAEGQKLGEKLWQQASRENPEQQRYLQTLAQRLLRINGKMQETAALSFGLVNSHGAAAKYWQDAARLAERQLTLESQGTRKPEYITFYGLQASARWMRASLSFVLAESSNKADDAWRQAHTFHAQGNNLPPPPPPSKPTPSQNPFFNND